MKVAVVCLLIGLAGIGIPVARADKVPQDEAWRHIELLRSKQEEVEKLLGQPADSAYAGVYSVGTDEVWIRYYYYDHCRPRFGTTGKWNIPERTVTEIVYVPEKEIALTSLKLNMNLFKKAYESPDVLDMVGYVNSADGVAYTLRSDEKTIYSIRYFPSLSDRHLRCEEK